MPDFSDLGATLVEPKKRRDSFSSSPQSQKVPDFSDLGATPVNDIDFSDLGATPATSGKLFPTALKAVAGAVSDRMKDWTGIDPIALNRHTPLIPASAMMGKAIDYGSKATGVDSKKWWTDNYPKVTGWTEGGVNVAEGLSTPENIGIMWAMQAAPKWLKNTPRVAKMLNVVASGGFSYMMAKDLPEIYTQYEAAKKSGNEREAARLQAIGFGQLLFATMSAAHAGKGVADLKGANKPVVRMGTPEELAHHKELLNETPPPPPETGSPPLVPVQPPKPSGGWGEGLTPDEAGSLLHINMIGEKPPRTSVITPQDLPSADLTTAVQSRTNGQGFVPGRGVQQGPETIAMITKKLAEAFGVTPMSIMEAMSDASRVRGEFATGGMPLESMDSASNAAFFGRIPLIGALTRMGMKGSDITAFAEALKAGDPEAVKFVMDKVIGSDLAMTEALPVKVEAPLTPPVPPAPSAEPWQMTREKFQETLPESVQPESHIAHERVLREAFQRGAIIPPEVLSQYPDLEIEFKKSLDAMREEVSAGEAGERLHTKDADGYRSDVIGVGSTFPEYFRNKGYTKEQVLNILDKFKAGKPLTDKQSGILSDLLEDRNVLEQRSKDKAANSERLSDAEEYEKFSRDVDEISKRPDEDVNPNAPKFGSPPNDVIAGHQGDFVSGKEEPVTRAELQGKTPGDMPLFAEGKPKFELPPQEPTKKESSGPAPEQPEFPSNAGFVMNPVEFASRLAAAVKRSKSYEEFKKLVESDKDLSDTVRFMSTNLQEAYDRNKKPFYSGLSRDINERMPSKASPEQVRSIFKDMNQEEVEWSGVNEWLKDKKTVSKSELMDFLKQNEVQVKEKIEPDIKFKNYSLSGGENSRVLKLMLPDRGSTKEIPGKFLTESEGNQFISSHFDEPNVLAHVRFNDRVDAQGKKVLFLEEIQSDWHQSGREKGYAGDKSISMDAIKKRSGEINQEIADLSNIHPERPMPQEVQVRLQELNREYYQLVDQSNVEVGKVPDAPFKKTWHELALKRMLRWASENGYDKIAWTTGEQQIDRYDLSKHLDAVEYKRLSPKEYQISMRLNDGSRTRVPQTISEGELADHVGKDLAEKIVKNPDDVGTFHGLDLKVGGEGMKGFYDQMIPAFLNKYAKKWGGRIGTDKINIAPEKNKDYYIKKSGGEFDIFDVQDPAGEPVAGGFKTYAEAKEYANNEFAQYNQVHSLDITPSMKESISDKGQPFYGQRGQTILLSEAAGRIMDIAKKAKNYADFRRLVSEDVDLTDTAKFYNMNLRQMYDEKRNAEESRNVSMSGLPKAVQKILQKENRLRGDRGAGKLTEREKFFGNEEPFPDLPMPVPEQSSTPQKVREFMGIGGGRANLERAAGEHGKALADEAEMARDLPSYRAAEFNNRLEDLAKTGKATKEELFNLKESLEGRAKPESAKVKAFFDEIDAQRNFLRSFRDDQLMGTKDLDPQLIKEERREWGLENYFPHKIPADTDLAPGGNRRVEVAEDMFNRKAKGISSVFQATALIDNYLAWKKNGSRPMKLAQYLVDSGQAVTMEDAFIRLEAARKYSNNFEDGFFKRREVDLPFYDPNPLRVVPEYNKRAMEYLYLKERFGEQTERLLGLVEKTVQKGGSREIAEGVKDWVLGIEKQSEFSKITRWLTNLQSIEKLSYAAIPNFFQGITGSGAVLGPRFGMKATFDKFFSKVAPKYGEEMRDFSRQVGQNPDYALLFQEDPGNMTKKMLGISGFRSTEIGNYTVSTFQGKATAIYYFKRLLKNPKDSYARKQLEALRVGVDRALENKELSKDDLLNAGNYAWRKTQGIPDPLTLPSSFLTIPVNSDAGRLMFQFKRVAYSSTRIMGDALKEAIYDRKPGKLLWLMIAYPAAGQIIQTVKEAIGVRPKDRDKDKKALEIYIDRLSAGFAFGILNDLYYSAYQKKVPVGATADQLVQTVASVMEAVGLKKGWSTTGQQVTNIPFIGRIIYNRWVKPALDRESKERAAETRAKKSGKLTMPLNLPKLGDIRKAR